jgi:hypothetical protein
MSGTDARGGTSAGDDDDGFDDDDGDDGDDDGSGFDDPAGFPRPRSLAPDEGHEASVASAAASHTATQHARMTSRT